MHIGAEAHIVGKIPAHMVGVLINHNLIRVPEPVIAEGQIGRGHRPVPAVEPEPARTAATNPPYVTGTKATGKVAMLPRLIEMVVRIAGTAIVPNPLLALHMRSSRMAGLFRSFGVCDGGFRRAVRRSRPVCRRASWMAGCFVLRHHRQREYQQSCECNGYGFHQFLLITT